jgi:signal transduction histidine kinase
MPQPPAKAIAERFAALRTDMARGGRQLHDEAGPLLAAAGLKLSLVRQDHPAAEPEIAEIFALLDKAMASIRTVSQQLNPSPAAHTGLKRALAALAETEPRIKLTHSTAAHASPEVASILYEAVVAAVRAAIASGASRIKIAVTGTAKIHIRVSDDGNSSGRAQALAVAILLARASGAALDIQTKRDTIVLIRYGL